MEVEATSSTRTYHPYANRYLNFGIRVPTTWMPHGTPHDVVTKLQQVAEFCHCFSLFSIDRGNSSFISVCKGHMADEFIRHMANDEKVTKNSAVDLTSSVTAFKSDVTEKDKCSGVYNGLEHLQKNYIRELRSARGLEPVERIVTRDMLVDIHRTVLYYDNRRGALRNKAEYISFVDCPITNKRHEYPSPEQIELNLDRFCDIYNLLMKELLQDIQENGYTFDTIEQNIKLATWAFYTFISLHPFRCVYSSFANSRIFWNF